ERAGTGTGSQGPEARWAVPAGDPAPGLSAAPHGSVLGHRAGRRLLDRRPLLRPGSGALLHPAYRAPGRNGAAGPVLRPALHASGEGRPAEAGWAGGGGLL